MTPIPLLQKVEKNILEPIIWLLITLSVAYFIYGAFEMVRDSGSGDARITGAKHVLWGTIGLFISLSVFGILHLICNTISC